MIKCALFVACLAQGPGIPPASNVFDVAPTMTASLSPGGVTQKQGTTKYTTITTYDQDTYKLWSIPLNKEIEVLLPKCPVLFASLNSASSGFGTFTVTSSTTSGGVTVRTHGNVLKSTGDLTQIEVVDTFQVVDQDTDVPARDAMITLGQQVTITKN
jgi:hypothetical protein